MTARCANKSKQTATSPPKITWLSVDSIQPDVMDVGVEQTFSPQNSPCSPGSSWMAFGLRRADVGLIVCAISFQDAQPMWSWSTNVTERWTDDMRSQNRTLHYSTSCGKNLLRYITPTRSHYDHDAPMFETTTMVKRRKIGTTIN